jgi:ankyrin repeat protein
MAGRAECVAALLDRGATPGSVDARGKTPLDLAAEERIPEIVEVEGLLRVSSIVM